MRSKLGTVLTGLLLVVVAAPAFAQVETMQVKVPFAFSVGKKTLPAGRYLISTNDLTTYTLSGQRTAAITMTDEVNSGAVKHEASLVFAKSGDQYSLLQIWTSDPHTGHFLQKAVSNKALSKAQPVEVLAMQ